LTIISKQNNFKNSRKGSTMSIFNYKSGNIYKRIKFNEKENKFFIFERPQTIISQIEFNLKKLKNLNPNEIEEVNEYFKFFFAEEEKFFLENYSNLEEGFLIKAIIDEYCEIPDEEEYVQKLEFSSSDNYYNTNKEFIKSSKSKKLF
jgi:hypothetical protein